MLRGRHDVLFNVRLYSLDQSDNVIVPPILIKWTNLFIGRLDTHERFHLHRDRKSLAFCTVTMVVLVAVACYSSLHCAKTK